MPVQLSAEIIESGFVVVLLAGESGILTRARLHSWLFGLVILVAVATIYLLQEHKAKTIREKVEAEFSKIIPPPKETPIEHKSAYKPGFVLVQTKYSLSGSFSEMVSYYSSELMRNGWSLRDDRTVEQGNESAVRIVTFCKNSYTAQLSYSASYSLYSFALTWGLPDCD